MVGEGCLGRSEAFLRGMMVGLGGCSCCLISDFGGIFMLFYSTNATFYVFLK